MVPVKGHEPSSGIQTLEYVIRGLYIVVGLVLVSSLVSAVMAAAKMFDRWDVCGRTRCKYCGLKFSLLFLRANFFLSIIFRFLFTHFKIIMFKRSFREKMPSFSICFLSRLGVCCLRKTSDFSEELYPMTDGLYSVSRGLDTIVFPSVIPFRRFGSDEATPLINDSRWLYWLYPLSKVFPLVSTIPLPPPPWFV